jgi:ABC-2 type transport system ATP-binding protein
MGLDRKDARKRADELLELFDLAVPGRRPVGSYSGGMRRRVDLACGLVVRPEVIFLDEPTTGLDPRSRQSVWHLISRLKDEGITVLLTTQYLEEVDLLSDKIIVIDGGTVISEGTADELKARTGGTFCEVVPRDPAQLGAVVQALGDLIPQALRDEAVALGDRVSIPAADGSETMAEVLRRIHTNGIAIADVALRRPSLDDVFLTLTGHPGTHS